MPHKPGFIHSGKDETSWNYFELPFGSGADYKKPIALENLPYTPAVLGEMLENKEKEREVDIEGLGKGRLVISKQNNNKPFFYPDQSEEYTAKKSRQLQIGEIAGNLPLLTSPLTTLGKGVPKIVKTKRETPRRLMEMSMKESSPKGAIDLKKTVDDVFNMPTQQSANYYKRAANVAKKNHISLTDAFKYLDSIQKGVRPDKPIKPGNITGITNKGLLKDTDVDDPTVYIPPEERIGTQKGDPLQMTDESKYQPPENFSGITPPTFEQSRQKINRAIGNDVYRRHADGVPRFDFVKLQNNKVFTSEYKRLIGSDISTIDEFGLPFAKRKRNVQYESRKAAFVGYRKELMDQYLEWYGPAMKRLNILPSQIDLDHRLTLIQSLGIYHNVDPKSQLWIDIQNTAVKRGIYPGDAERNLDLADPESHRVKSNYFNDLHGLKTHNNMKYWGGLHRDTGKTRLQIMEESHLGPEYEKLHLEIVNDYFDVAERGNKILDSARAMWKAENMKGILPEEIVTTLMQVSIDPKYSTKQLNQIVKSMMDVEIEKYSKFQRLFEIELELEVIGSSPETILDTDTQVIKDLKKEYKKLKTVRKSPWFKNHYKQMMKTRDAEIASPQRNIFELLEFLFPD